MLWKYRPFDPDRARLLARNLSLPVKCGEFLAARGFSEEWQVNNFLSGDLKKLPAPETMPGLDNGVRLILEALDSDKTIAIAGDYDADGLTATALLYRVLKAAGARVLTRVPNRLSEGYGLSVTAVTELKEEKADLLITVDCGISDFEAIKKAGELDLPTIVTDHHRLPPELPPAAAIINPHLGGGWEENPLAGVGVAFMLAWGLIRVLKNRGRELNISLVENLALVALGTIADVAPLVGPNRILVTHGLNFLAKLNWPGLKALRKRVIKKEGYVSVRDVGFGFAPRLNAAGRLGETDVALDILITENHAEAERLAEKLENFNRIRLKNQNALLEEALEQLAEQELDIISARTVVLAGEGWAKGLLGLVASRIAETTMRPTILMTVEGGLATGSGRSVPGFNLFQALDPLRDLCKSVGGHAQAAGLKIDPDKIDAFREAFERSARNQDPPEAEPQLEVDLVANLPDLEQILPVLAKLEPFGPGHPAPVAVLKNVRVLEAVPTKSNGDQHMHLRLYDGLTKVGFVGFKLAPRLHEIGTRVDVAVQLETEKFGQHEPSWRLLDFKTPAV
ncbi:MAG: single-stranded-DNA-specific exonuclease RecJ [Deltaproteobacteria bacterium]|jgi:single-stranded-DNA-specific exonuclease|nr:single-stranded-DNA-specific exonuclease RecJ [Deltaproteobacteria bacterium]